MKIRFDKERFEQLMYVCQEASNFQIANIEATELRLDRQEINAFEASFYIVGFTSELLSIYEFWESLLIYESNQERRQKVSAIIKDARKHFDNYEVINSEDVAVKIVNKSNLN